MCGSSGNKTINHPRRAEHARSSAVPDVVEGIGELLACDGGFVRPISAAGAQALVLIRPGKAEYAEFKDVNEQLSLTGLYSMLLSIALLAGCAGGGGSGKQITTSMKIGEPGPTKAKVVFVRSPGARYAKFAVHDADRLVAIVPYHSYCIYECEPGHHRFSATLGNVAILDADLLPARVYYVEVHETHGLVAPGVEMHPIYPNCKGNKWKHLPKWLDSAREVVLDDAAIEHDKKGIAEYVARVEKYREEKYMTDPGRERILPEHGQIKPTVPPQ